jgi:hypothetical protein
MSKKVMKRVLVALLAGSMIMGTVMTASAASTGPKANNWGDQSIIANDGKQDKPTAEVKYVITYDGNGHKFEEFTGVFGLVDALFVEYYGISTSVYLPVQEDDGTLVWSNGVQARLVGGDTLAYWSFDKAGKDRVPVDWAPTSSVTVYAQYGVETTINFNYNVDLAGAPIYVNGLHVFKQAAIVGQEFQTVWPWDPGTAPAGYKFVYWALDAAGTLPAMGDVVVTPNMTVYATYVIQEANPMYRLYNPNTGEHLYTAAAVEVEFLCKIGWQFENVGWFAPDTSDYPVYRLFNPNAVGGDHHYTLNANERDALVAAGWNDEGIGWYSYGKYSAPENIDLYRQYNPNNGRHNYTTSKAENDYLVRLGWNFEGFAWYGIEAAPLT